MTQSIPLTDPSSPVTLEFDTERKVGTVTFNRVAVFNALDVATAVAFEHAVAQLKRAPGLRCVVITGAGKAFMAGGDVGAFAADLDRADRTLDQILNHMHPALTTLRRIDAPVVAGVNGTAAGAGLSLVLAADYVVAHPAAKLVLAYDKLGVPPDCGGSWFLARKVGRAKAFELMLTGQVLDAAAAAKAGIVNLVTGPDDYADQLARTVQRIADGPTRAFGLFKRLMDADLPLAAHMEMERDGFVAAIQTADFREAATAFVAKRQPIYRGE
jgi:2-(1,2-epoxy-1,2-dihydrophenyl)acetyl-CoA isomerase